VLLRLVDNQCESCVDEVADHPIEQPGPYLINEGAIGVQLKLFNVEIEVREAEEEAVEACDQPKDVTR
jgi:hypothetical protein